MREDRQRLWQEYRGDKPPHMERPWLTYDRYRYADQIIQTLQKRGVDFTQLLVVDYGCGVGDYGFEFGRHGAEVLFYDTTTYLSFLQFRVAKDPTKFRHRLIPSSATFSLERVNAVIFGEVLEHLADPLAVLQKFANHQTQYIFTSSYPFRSDDPNDPYWHKAGHKEHDTRVLQQPCRELLFTAYNRVRYNGEASLWVRK